MSLLRILIVLTICLGAGWVWADDDSATATTKTEAVPSIEPCDTKCSTAKTGNYSDPHADEAGAPAKAADDLGQPAPGSDTKPSDAHE